MKYAYERQGSGLLTWGMAAPKESRAGETASLGSLGGATLVLPAPGAPEPILSGVGGCSCQGSCGCGGGAMSDFVDSVPGGYITLGVAAFLAWKMLRKRR